LIPSVFFLLGRAKNTAFCVHTSDGGERGEQKSLKMLRNQRIREMRATAIGRECR
jgi:hypothetical protein